MGGVVEGRRESGDDQGATDQATGRKLTVSEAANDLGISADAIRSRIKRGTLPTVREGGRVFVVLGDTGRPSAQAQPTTPPGEDRLYQEMQARIHYLESQVEEEREARRRADTLLARLMDRMPELEAPSEVRESPETAMGSEAEPKRAEPGSSVGVAEEGEQRRGFWSRLFGS
jgi:excisionase family DNA binding protein